MSSKGTAVVTGAAGGLGTAFARRLSADGHRLVLVDRDADGLAALGDELRRGGADCVEAVADLARAADVASVSDQLAAIDDLSLLVNNAGFGLVCRFQSIDMARVLDMIHVHVIASVTLCRAALPGMIARGHGGIINVASAIAYMRFPRDATYVSTKAYLLAFTECLALDLVGTGVKVQALCPGWVTTEFSRRPELSRVGCESPVPRLLFTSPERVVASSMRALGRARVAHIPTCRARLATRLIGSRLGMWVLSQLRKRGGGQHFADD